MRNSWLNHPLLRGALPRIGLATFGGVMAGGFFDELKAKLTNSGKP